MTSPNGMDVEIEDGELRKSPISKEPSLESLSLTDEEAMDNLEIKPPQARVHKSHRKSKHSSSSSKRHTASDHRKKHHHSRSHREERHRHHRERKEERDIVMKDRKDGGGSSVGSGSGSRRHEQRREEREKAKEEARAAAAAAAALEEQRKEERRREEEKREERRLERDLRERLEQRRTEGETAKEKEERELRRQRLMEAERVKETYRKDMEERRARREQRERSRSRERKLEAYQAEVQAEMERAGLVVVSDESNSPLIEEGDRTPVGPKNGGAGGHSSDEIEHTPPRRRRSSDSSSSTESDSEEAEEEEEDEDESTSEDKTPQDKKEPVEVAPSPPKPTLPSYLPAIMGCRSVEEFHCLNRIEEGTYGVVYRAKDKRTEEIVALKRLKMEKEKEGFPITSLREINTLLKAQHPNIVCVKEIVVGSNMDKIFIVMDYVEHDLKSLMETMKQKKQAFVPAEVKCLMRQLLAAVAHLHDNWILHRDLKTSNLLLSHKGVLRVGDFGLAREYGSPLKPYTPIVVTLWYRAPELLLGIKEYSTPIDMWSVGCIFAELLTMEPLFTGKSDIDQLNRIFKALGTPNERIWPGYSKLPAVQKMTFTEFPISTLRNRFTNLSDLGLSMLNGFLTYNPVERATAEGSIKHAYFSEPPLPIDPAMFPTWPAKSEPGHHRKKVCSPKPPSGGQNYKQLEDTDEGFHMGQIDRNRSINLGPGFSLKF